MSKATRNKSSRVIIVKDEAEFYGSIDKKLKQQGYVLLETVPKVCVKASKKTFP